MAIRFLIQYLVRGSFIETALATAMEPVTAVAIIHGNLSEGIIAIPSPGRHDILHLGCDRHGAHPAADRLRRSQLS